MSIRGSCERPLPCLLMIYLQMRKLRQRHQKGQSVKATGSAHSVPCQATQPDSSCSGGCDAMPRGCTGDCSKAMAGGSTGLLMDLAANEKAVHADFFNDFEDLFDDDDVQ
ncbi:PREDICTED: myeloma-overexpressed gene 2 protein [Dipodomys ordii]|uniref:COP9 signalosome complex subunit 9 n=1 Tax=Dipodomys ordii TaxID=10020 RepID=A0A1S3GT75_DIPOR|nr:PREDICTED: myeloma-overexpressed gene 2 protein [Dipodomys ordii]